jgi:hypothetical protein
VTPLAIFGPGIVIRVLVSLLDSYGEAMSSSLGISAQIPESQSPCLVAMSSSSFSHSIGFAKHSFAVALEFFWIFLIFMIFLRSLVPFFFSFFGAFWGLSFGFGESAFLGVDSL